MRVLITGGAGYIGSHTAKAVIAAGHQAVVFDNLTVGKRRVERWCPLVQGDLNDCSLIRETIRNHRLDSVIHFAAHAYVGESVTHPAKYFQNNVSNTITLLNAMIAEDISKLVFSSSCATYGNPERLPIAEDHPQCPVNPYGESKLAIERMLRWYGEAYGLRSVVLRYFNAAGADLSGELGEDHEPETHLIPLVILAALGVRRQIEVYGTSYPTRDGTAIRDYVHVEDLAAAHLCALHSLAHGKPSSSLNLGTGQGHSVREVIAAVAELVGPVALCELPARPGDPASLIADASLAAEVLGWRPKSSDLRTIVESAARWHVKLASLKGSTSA